MKILTVDTSTSMATAAVYEDGKLLSLNSSMAPKGHSQKIFGLIKQVIVEANIKVEDIDIFGCSIGPGSFTGLRIGATAVTGLAHGLRKKLIGIPTLDVLAAGIFRFDGMICSMLDAQRNSVYSAVYRWEENELVKLEDFGVIEIDKIEERIASLLQKFSNIDFSNNKKNVVFCGDALPIYEERIKAFNAFSAIIPQGGLIYPSASALAWLVDKRKDDSSNPGELRLEYIRKAQAEVEYSHRNPINIRKMRIDDIDQVHEIENMSFRTPWSKEAFFEELKNLLSMYLVAEVGGRIAGYCGLWKIIDEAHITNVGVHPGYQGMGIGEMLMKEAMINSKEDGMDKMTLEVRTSNLAALNLYKKLNFKSAGIRKGYYTDTKEDAVIMWVSL